MKLMPQSASINQLLALLYLLVTIPAMTFIVLVVQGLDTQIETAQQQTSARHELVKPANPSAGKSENSNDYWLAPLGAALRGSELPFTTSSKLDPTNSYHLKLAQNLSDLRAVLIYTTLSIFALGAGLVWKLAIQLKRPLRAITNSINRLAQAELHAPIEIQGPRNIRQIGGGLEKLRIRLGENDSQQKQFLRHISHEIKTPLTSIKEGSNLLEDEIVGPINPAQREITTIISKSTRELQTSIENLLNYNSAISVDSIKQREMVNLAELVPVVLEKHALAIRNKRLHIKTNLSPSRSFVDQQQISTVFENLLSNAIKFSEDEGEIKIWLKQGHQHTVFTIRDYGTGVSDKHRSGIFEAFYVGSQSKHLPLKGTGLGLSIARQYVEQHNGTIELLKTRQGAAFQVTLRH